MGQAVRQSATFRVGLLAVPRKICDQTKLSISNRLGLDGSGQAGEVPAGCRRARAGCDRRSAWISIRFGDRLESVGGEGGWSSPPRRGELDHHIAMFHQSLVMMNSGAPSNS